MDELVTDSDSDDRLLWGLDCVAGQLVLLSRTLAIIAWQFDNAALARVSTELSQRVGAVMHAREELTDHRPSRVGRPSVRVGWGTAPQARRPPPRPTTGAR
jgi:hypothetical protein